MFIYEASLNTTNPGNLQFETIYFHVIGIIKADTDVEWSEP